MTEVMTKRHFNSDTLLGIWNYNLMTIHNTYICGTSKMQVTINCYSVES